MTFDDFLKKTIEKSLWVWLPFHAFRRLIREYRQQKK